MKSQTDTKNTVKLSKGLENIPEQEWCWLFSKVAFPPCSRRYTVGRTLGDGNFAVVRECVERSTGREYALKIINKGKCRGKEHMIQNEVAILRRVKHPNIVLLIEEVDTYNELYLVMELVKGGDLFDAITSANRYTERDASGMLHNLANAIKHLHSLNIVHRDIKPENLLVYEHADGSKSLKLGDFGLATVVDGPLYTVCGTPTYVAPEIISETGYGLKVDIWAAGVITYILLCGFPPFRGSSDDQEVLFDQILTGQLEFPLPYWDNVSETAKDLIRVMLEVEVDQRFTALQVLEHPWVTDEGLCENHHQLSVAGKIKKHFNTSPKGNDTTAGVSVISLDDSFSMQRSGSLDFYQHPAMYWIRYWRLLPPPHVLLLVSGWVFLFSLCFHPVLHNVAVCVREPVSDVMFLCVRCSHPSASVTSPHFLCDCCLSEMCPSSFACCPHSFIIIIWSVILLLLLT
uniref:non-specific serine/threonine protein kinase n=1 Tax=Takifugu rubripes TaxID=31033 RepID=A0A674NST6_TAKRU